MFFRGTNNGFHSGTRWYLCRHYNPCTYLTLFESFEGDWVHNGTCNCWPCATRVSLVSCTSWPVLFIPCSSHPLFGFQICKACRSSRPCNLHGHVSLVSSKTLRCSNRTTLPVSDTFFCSLCGCANEQGPTDCKSLCIMLHGICPAESEIGAEHEADPLPKMLNYSGRCGCRFVSIQFASPHCARQ